MTKTMQKDKESIEKRYKIKEYSEYLEKERVCQKKNYKDINEIKRN